MDISRNDDEFAELGADAEEKEVAITSIVLLVAVPVYIASLLFIVVRPVLFHIGVPEAYTMGASILAVMPSLVIALILLHNGSLSSPFNGFSGWLYDHLVAFPAVALVLIAYYEMYLFPDAATTLPGHIALGSMFAALGIMALIVLMTPPEKR